MSMQKEISPAKLKAREKVIALAQDYDVVGLVKISKMGAKQITDLRSKLRGTAQILVAKKTIMKMAFDEVKGKTGLKDLFEVYDEKIGPSALIFTNLRAISLRRILDENKTTTRAKIGDMIDKEIVVPAGNTNIPPGPVISELASAGLPTKIQNGTIWIQKDTTVLKPGDVVDYKMSMVLGRLGIEPIEIGLDLYSAHEGGELLTKDMLTIDIGIYKEKLMAAYANAMKLSVELGIVTPENAKMVLQKAYMNAKALAMELPIVIPDLVADYLAKAQRQALVLNAAITGEPLASPSPVPAAEQHEQETSTQEEEKPEEEEALGLDDLFG